MVLANKALQLRETLLHAADLFVMWEVEAVRSHCEC